MKKTVCPFFMTIFYLGLLFLMVPPAIAEPPADISITQTASAQQQPGSKEPEGLEPEPPSSFSIGWDVTFASKYLFQGRDYGDGKAVVQGGMGPFSGGLFRPLLQCLAESFSQHPLRF